MRNVCDTFLSMFLYMLEIRLFAFNIYKIFLLGPNMQIKQLVINNESKIKNSVIFQILCVVNQKEIKHL